MFAADYLVTTLRWQDLVDIILNSYILFRLYVLFQGTQVIRVVIGVGFLWILQGLSRQLGLIVTSWVLQGIIALAALIIIIVFRNEIRRVIQAKNLRVLLWGWPQNGDITPTGVIVESVYELARRRIGALIVLPDKDDLSDLVQGGVAWGGRLTKQMLISIFWPGNPVHDGAALVRNGRIEKVGAILPLSNKDDLPQRYGTRHRAALGLSENCDALVIVVSEERGEVTVAKDGQLHEIPDNLALTRHIRYHSKPVPGIDRAGRKHSLRLAAAALVCLLFVTGIWFRFARGLETLTTVEVPIEYMNRDQNVEILDTSVNQVVLHLTGSRALIKSLEPEQLKVMLDLGKAVVGTNTFSITADNIVLPPGIRLTRIEPVKVKVAIDRIVSKTLPIQVDWAGKLPRGLVIEQIEVRPGKTVLVGPSRILASITTVYTEKINLENIHSSGKLTADLVISPASVKVASGSVDKVTIEYRVKSRQN